MTNSLIEPRLSDEFISMMIDLLGAEEADELVRALDMESPTSIRFNQSKSLSLDLRSTKLEPVQWCPWGYYLPERPLFTGDPLFHAGYYYVQEASSMLLYQVKKLLPNKPLVALDLCAAPGGKSTLLLDILPKDSVLVSNEVVGHRANILVENMQKWGNPRSIVTSAYPESWSKCRETFDFILVDAPCSGEGMFRKDPQARREWTPSSPRQCADRQRDILNSVWQALTPGGYMVYSTCTINKEENEDIVAYIHDTFGATPIDLNLEEGVCSRLSPYPCYRMMPHRMRGEGLFMAVFRKEVDDAECISTKRADKKSNIPKSVVPKEVKAWVSAECKDWHWQIYSDDIVYTYPEDISPLLEKLTKQKIHLLSFGVPVAILRGKSSLPHAGLAYSIVFNRDSFNVSDVAYADAISLLSRETIVLDTSLPQGIRLITYRGFPLGFVKHLGNRTNNLYPQHWRIKQPERIRETIVIDDPRSLSESCLSQYLIFD